MYSIHAYLFDRDFDLEQCEVELTRLFTGESRGGLMLSRSANPFTNEQYLIFRWPDWSLTAHVEHGARVLADANFIRAAAADVFPGTDPICRLRVVFGNDESLEYTNHIIWVEEFLATIPSAILYDEAQEKLRSTIAQQCAPADGLRPPLS